MLKEAGAGAKVAGLCRKHGISEHLVQLEGRVQRYGRLGCAATDVTSVGDVPAGSFRDSEILGTGGHIVYASVCIDGGTLLEEVKGYKLWKTVDGVPLRNAVDSTRQILQQVLKESWLQASREGWQL